MTPAFVAELGISIWSTDIGAQKIDCSTLKTYDIVIAGFSIQDKTGKIWFFEEPFLLANTSMEIVLEMPFLAFSNANIQFDTECFIWRSYSTAKALPTTKRVDLIDKHKFTKAALDENSETFVVQVAVLEALEPVVHPSRAPLLAALQ